MTRRVPDRPGLEKQIVAIIRIEFCRRAQRDRSPSAPLGRGVPCHVTNNKGALTHVVYLQQYGFFDAGLQPWEFVTLIESTQRLKNWPTLEGISVCYNCRKDVMIANYQQLQ
jgi:hypothetical protein